MKTKTCKCGAILGNTVTKCNACGHEFIGRARRSRMRKAGELAAPIRMKPGRKPKFDAEAPETDAAIDRLLVKATPKPAAVIADFEVDAPKDGGLTLRWTTEPVVELELTARERGILLKALTA